MTGPIIYDPTPHPTLPQLADGADAFGDVSTVVANNFAKLNTRLRGNPARWTYFQGSQQEVATYTGFSDWTSVMGWATDSITLPGRVAGALFIVRGQANTGGVGSYPSMALTVEPTGPGIVHAPPRLSMAVASLWGLNEGARTWFFQAADLNPGQSVTMTPYAAHNDVTDAYINHGQWQLIVFSGDPS